MSEIPRTADDWPSFGVVTIGDHIEYRMTTKNLDLSVGQNESTNVDWWVEHHGVVVMHGYGLESLSAAFEAVQ